MLQQTEYPIPPNPPPDVSRTVPGFSAYGIFLTAVCTFIVALRMYTRLWLKRNAGWDDALIVPGLIFAVGYTACNQVQIYVGGFGRHQYYLTSEQLVVVEKSNVAVNIFLAASFFFSRASICVLLLRVVQKVWLWRWILYGLLVLDAMVGIGTILVYAFLCVPLDKTWYPEKVGHCMAFSTLDKSATVFAALNIVIDFGCAGVSFVIVHNLQLDRKAKIGLWAILCCGLVTAACSVGRIITLDFHAQDKTYDLVPFAYWSIAEADGAVLVASLPALHQLYKHLRQEKTLSRSSSNTTSPKSRAALTFASSSSGRRAKMPSNSLLQNASPSGHDSYFNDGSKQGRCMGITRTTDVYIELSDNNSMVDKPERALGLDHRMV